MSPRREPAYRIGQLVVMARPGAREGRAVVVDIDFGYEDAASWGEELSAEIEADPQPWYRLLVDGGAEAYVAEDQLAADPAPRPIDHPEVEREFDTFEHGYYARTVGLD